MLFAALWNNKSLLAWGKLKDRDSGAPHFSPQTQFLKAFLDHRVTKSCKVTELLLKFEDQIAGNRIFKVSVFKISQGQSARIPLDGSHLQLSTMGPPTLNYAPRSLKEVFQEYDTVHFWKPSIDLHKSRCTCTIIFFASALHEAKNAAMLH